MAAVMDLSVANGLGIDQGETYNLEVAYASPSADPDAPSEPIDLTGCTARMQMREKYGSPVLLEANTENGGIDIDGPAGVINVLLTDVQTDALGVKEGSTRPRTAALYDLEIVFPSGTVRRVVQGAVEIDPNITRDSA